jgi:Zn-dependent protease with chaperone function
MHLIVSVAIFALAWGLRYSWIETDRLTWIDRWNLTLSKFLLPPLLLFTTSVSIVWMGPHGRMVWVGNDWLSYNIAIGYLGFGAFYLVKLTLTGWQIRQQVRTYPEIKLNGKKVRLLDLPAIYIAQIGFWQPELVITQGLLDNLGKEHLAAVLAHEQAHYRYRDTFCFFWLGWIRRITIWLPQTEVMWQELLVLRELRADRWASKQTAPLLVAEALLLVVQNTSIFTEDFCTAFSQFAPVVGKASSLNETLCEQNENRLSQRINALLAIYELDRLPTQKLQQSTDRWIWIYLLVGLLPLLTIPFHR